MLKQVKAGLKKVIYLSKPIHRKVNEDKHSNVEYNRALWDHYAKNWDARHIPLEDKKMSVKDVTHLGDEWGKREDVEQVLQGFIYPYVDKDKVVGEIGTGGGRIASKVAARTKEFYCFDISTEMLKKVKESLRDQSHIQYVVLKGPAFSPSLNGRFDFMYSFDVFVHLDLHTIWRYFLGIHGLLKKGGKAFVSTANLKAPKGWQRFAGQDTYSIEGHYFISPEIVHILAERAHLKVIKTSAPDSKNFYFDRDYLVVLEK